MQLRALKLDADGLVVVENAAVVAIGAAPQGLKNASLCNETPFFRGFHYILWLTVWRGNCYTFHQNPLFQGVSLQRMTWNP
jgi:hypothetical protein